MVNRNSPTNEKSFDSFKGGVGKRVRKLRECNNLTQEELAAVLDVSPRHLSYIEASARGLTLENAIVLAREYSVTLDYIYLGRTDNENLDPVCRVVHDIMNSNKDEETRELYIKTILDISNLTKKAKK